MSRIYILQTKIKLKIIMENSKNVVLYDYDISNEYLDDVRKAGVVAWDIEISGLDW